MAGRIRELCVDVFCLCDKAALYRVQIYKCIPGIYVITRVIRV